MALLVLDDCNVGIGKAPNGGFMLRLDGGPFPPGFSLLIPFEGDNAVEVHKGIGEAIGKKSRVMPASPIDMAQEVKRHGPYTAE